MGMLCSILAVILGFVLQNEMPNEQGRESTEARQQAIQLNELAGRIESEADSEKLVDSVAEMFKSELPPAWGKRGVLQQVARAEYKAATDASYLIPEERIADVWNEYVREIGAPNEAIVTVAEIHRLRDAQYASGQMLWMSDMNRSIWTMPHIVAVGPDGKVAKGCRALEALRVIFLMDTLFENVRSARNQVQNGIVVSDELAKNRTQQSERAVASLRFATIDAKDANPLPPAEQRYIHEHGLDSFNLLVQRLFTKLFPE
jgi:hypothetical protein